MNMSTFIIIVSFTSDNIEHVGPFFSKSSADNYKMVLEEYLPASIVKVQELISPIQTKDRIWRKRNAV